MTAAPDAAVEDFILPRHTAAFERAARLHDVYILVRQTGKASLQWVGKPGYTAKRADMKCKTADLNVYVNGTRRVWGLVCSPRIHPAAFSRDRLKKASDLWDQSQHLITVPRSPGFTDTMRVKCPTPYALQTDPAHKHYGCIAWVEGGLVQPKYVHGDYDLFAIVPAGNPAVRSTQVRSFSGLSSSSQSLSANLRMSEPVDHCGPLQFKVMNHLDAAIGFPMVMHGEQENFEPLGEKEQVLAFFPKPRDGQSWKILKTREEVDRFYAAELGGRQGARTRPKPPLSDAFGRPI
jgi:hypothetical protein